MSTERENPGTSPSRWPFDPLQPGDHEPVALPDHLEKAPMAPPSPPQKEHTP